MRLLKSLQTSVLVAVMTAFLLIMGPVLHGCSDQSAAFERVAGAFGIDPFPVPEETERELHRMDAIYANYAEDPADKQALDQFRDAYKRIYTAYVVPVDDDQLMSAAIEGVLKDSPEPHSLPNDTVTEKALDALTATLDPHSAYLTPKELLETELITSGEFGGLGIQVTQEDDNVKIISPIEGTPADHAGLKPGDLITHLDGQPLKGLSLREAVDRLRGAPDTNIVLTIQRGDAPPFDVAITRAIITLDPVRWQLEGGIGYVRISTFNEKTTDRLDEAMAAMEKAHGGRLKGLVIDLRNNPGGLLDQSLAVADDFLDSGTIVSIRGRGSADAHRFDAEQGDLAEGLPVVVLINAGSASASEIVAAALQDNRRATVMGSRSFGKGSVQTVMRLPRGGALKITTALYYGPDGESIQALGVVPDIAIHQEGETVTKVAHENDLPGFLPAQGQTVVEPLASINGESCPAIGEAGDRDLGCALVFLRSGSTDKFLAALQGEPKL